eukprot:GILK01011601.1.p1 GENE.GILK01011601.1~~GILK01011601.1.p1  ORF type:complete len:191 (+),score=15.02 GILK01011601.1:88-660(+)
MDAWWSKHVQPALKMLADEGYILDKLIYKNNYQHRKSMHFRRLKDVQRRLRSFLKSDFISIRPLLSNTTSNNQSSQIVQLLYVLIFAMGELDELLTAISKSGESFFTLLSQSFFMPFALTVVSMLGRLQVLLQNMLDGLLDKYESLFVSLSPSIDRTALVQDFRIVFIASAEHLHTLLENYTPKPRAAAS